MTHNNSNYSFLHPKNIYTVIRIPPKYDFITHDRMKKDSDKLIIMSYETYTV
jgi:hypothetical protein